MLGSLENPKPRFFAMSQFPEDLLRPHIVDTTLDDGYRAMATDAAREADALEWCNALIVDMADGDSDEEEEETTVEAGAGNGNGAHHAC